MPVGMLVAKCWNNTAFCNCRDDCLAVRQLMLCCWNDCFVVYGDIEEAPGGMDRSTSAQVRCSLPCHLWERRMSPAQQQVAVCTMGVLRWKRTWSHEWHPWSSASRMVDFTMWSTTRNPNQFLSYHLPHVRIPSRVIWLSNELMCCLKLLLSIEVSRLLVKLWYSLQKVPNMMKRSLLRLFSGDSSRNTSFLWCY